jgi:hypothetical protein
MPDLSKQAIRERSKVPTPPEWRAVSTRKMVFLFVVWSLSPACKIVTPPPTASQHRKMKSALHFPLKFKIIILRQAFSGKTKMGIYREKGSPDVDPQDPGSGRC